MWKGDYSTRRTLSDWNRIIIFLQNAIQPYLLQIHSVVLMVLAVSFWTEIQTWNIDSSTSAECRFRNWQLGGYLLLRPCLKESKLFWLSFTRRRIEKCAVMPLMLLLCPNEIRCWSNSLMRIEGFPTWSMSTKRDSPEKKRQTGPVVSTTRSSKRCAEVRHVLLRQYDEPDLSHQGELQDLSTKEAGNGRFS